MGSQTRTTKSKPPRISLLQRMGQKPPASGQHRRARNSLRKASWGLTTAGTADAPFKPIVCSVNSCTLLFLPEQNKLLLASTFSNFRTAHRQNRAPLVRKGEHSFPASKGHRERVVATSHTHRGAFLASGFQSCLCSYLPQPALFISTQRCVHP